MVGSPFGVLALGVSTVMTAHTGNRSLVSVLGRLHLVDEGAASPPQPVVEVPELGVPVDVLTTLGGLHVRLPAL